MHEDFPLEEEILEGLEVYADFECEPRVDISLQY